MKERLFVAGLGEVEDEGFRIVENSLNLRHVAEWASSQGHPNLVVLLPESSDHAVVPPSLFPHVHMVRTLADSLAVLMHHASKRINVPALLHKGLERLHRRIVRHPLAIPALGGEMNVARWRGVFREVFLNRNVSPVILLEGAHGLGKTSFLLNVAWHLRNTIPILWVNAGMVEWEKGKDVAVVLGESALRSMGFRTPAHLVFPMAFWIRHTRPGWVFLDQMEYFTGDVISLVREIRRMGWRVLLFGPQDVIQRIRNLFRLEDASADERPLWVFLRIPTAFSGVSEERRLMFRDWYYDHAFLSLTHGIFFHFLYTSFRQVGPFEPHDIPGWMLQEAIRHVLKKTRLPADDRTVDIFFWTLLRTLERGVRLGHTGNYDRVSAQNVWTHGPGNPELWNIPLRPGEPAVMDIVRTVYPDSRHAWRVLKYVIVESLERSDIARIWEWDGGTGLHFSHPYLEAFFAGAGRSLEISDTDTLLENLPLRFHDSLALWEDSETYRWWTVWAQGLVWGFLKRNELSEDQSYSLLKALLETYFPHSPEMVGSLLPLFHLYTHSLSTLLRTWTTRDDFPGMLFHCSCSLTDVPTVSTTLREVLSDYANYTDHFLTWVREKRPGALGLVVWYLRTRSPFERRPDFWTRVLDTIIQVHDSRTLLWFFHELLSSRIPEFGPDPVADYLASRLPEIHAWLLPAIERWESCTSKNFLSSMAFRPPIRNGCHLLSQLSVSHGASLASYYASHPDHLIRVLSSELPHPHAFLARLLSGWSFSPHTDVQALVQNLRKHDPKSLADFAFYAFAAPSFAQEALEALGDDVKDLPEAIVSTVLTELASEESRRNALFSWVQRHLDTLFSHHRKALVDVLDRMFYGPALRFLENLDEERRRLLLTDILRRSTSLGLQIGSNLPFELPGTFPNLRRTFAEVVYELVTTRHMAFSSLYPIPEDFFLHQQLAEWETWEALLRRELQQALREPEHARDVLRFLREVVEACPRRMQNFVEREAETIVKVLILYDHTQAPDSPQFTVVQEFVNQFRETLLLAYGRDFLRSLRDRIRFSGELEGMEDFDEFLTWLTGVTIPAVGTAEKNDTDEGPLLEVYVTRDPLPDGGEDLLPEAYLAPLKDRVLPVDVRVRRLASGPSLLYLHGLSELDVQHVPEMLKRVWKAIRPYGPHPEQPLEIHLGLPDDPYLPGHVPALLLARLATTL